ncbi:MAG TPA: insulinase family protein [Gammaproteobacteria bacterium]|nr:insulinase family protein [Gammaproteobacteria bacterium]
MRLTILLGLLLSTGLAVAGPDIQHWTTLNGVRVYFVPAAQLPMLDIRIQFDAGSARDNGKAGLASLTNHLFSFGADGLSADQIANRLEGVGANASSGADRDTGWLSLRSLSDPALMKPSLQVLEKMLARPDFNEADFKREQQRVLVALKQSEQSPASQASKAFYRAVYGAHPYASPVSGTIESVKALTTKDLKTFYQRYYVAKNAVIAMVGDIDRKHAERIAERLSARLEQGQAAAALLPVKDLTAASTEHIEFPSSQTHIRIGQPGMYRGDPDYFALYVANHVLGGSGLVSLLAEEVREKRGLAYSVYSYFVPLRRKGPFIVGMQTRNDQVTESMKVLRDTLNKYIKDGISAEQLSTAKKSITGGFPLRIDSNSKIVGYLAMIGYYKLPLDYLDRFNERINGLSLHQVRDAFRRRLQPGSMVTVTVGQRQVEK